MISRSDSSRFVFRWATVWVGVVAASALVPRFVPRSDGLASAATAVMVFLLLVLLSFFLAALLFAHTWRRRGELDRWVRLVGFVPLMVSGGVLAAVFILLRY